MRGRPTHRTIAAIVAVMAVVVMLSTALVFGASKPRVWLDRPLPGAILLYGPTTVTVHAASPSGISVVRFSVDGSPAAEVGAPGGELVTVEWAWTPESPGVHVVTAFARGVDGVFSDPVAATVTFVSRDELPPSPPPAPSSEPLPTPTFVATPGPSGPGTSASPGASGGPSPSVDPRESPSVPPDPTPTPTPTEPPCVVPIPTLITPASDTTYYEPVLPTYEWSLSEGDPGCVVEIVLWLNVRDGHTDFPAPWLYSHTLQPHETFYQFPDYVLTTDPDGNLETGCGIYWWWVEVIGPEYGEQSAQSSIYVCPPP